MIPPDFSPAAIERYGPGFEVTDPRPGDFFLTHGSDLYAVAIRLGQKLRIHGPDEPFTHWNHAGLFIGGEGEIVEAVREGIVARSIAAYRPTDYSVVKLGIPDEDRAQMVAFARSALGAQYGFWTIGSIVLSLLTGAKLSVRMDGTYICSELVARALERAGYCSDRAPENIAPADLAKYFGVLPPGGR